jgi:hypothetical protein
MEDFEHTVAKMTFIKYTQEDEEQLWALGIKQRR